MYVEAAFLAVYGDDVSVQDCTTNMYWLTPRIEQHSPAKDVHVADGIWGCIEEIQKTITTLDPMTVIHVTTNQLC